MSRFSVGIQPSNSHSLFRSLSAVYALSRSTHSELRNEYRFRAVLVLRAGNLTITGFLSNSISDSFTWTVSPIRAPVLTMKLIIAFCFVVPCRMQFLICSRVGCLSSVTLEESMGRTACLRSSSSIPSFRYRNSLTSLNLWPKMVEAAAPRSCMASIMALMDW